MNVVKIELIDKQGRKIIVPLDGSMDTVDFMRLEEILNDSKIVVDVLEYSKENNSENV